MPTTTDATLTEGLQETAHRLTGVSQDYDPLMDRIGNARFVLLGEASHGTHEFNTSAPRSRTGLSGRKALRPSRSRLIGPTPTASTATCTPRVTTFLPYKRLPTSGGSRRG